MEQSADLPQRPVARKILMDLSIMVVIGVVLAVIGPLGSFQDPFPSRLIAWISFAVIGYALYAPIDTLAQRMQPMLAMPAWWLSVVACLVATVPMAVVVWIIPRLPFPVRWPDLHTALLHYAYVLVIGGMITGIFFVIGRYQDAAALRQQSANSQSEAVQAEPAVSAPSVEHTPSEARLLARLPAALGTDIIALENEDHYVRVHTALGSELVLMRMRDAVAELEGVDGLQVHRSWWVARGAVEDVHRDGRNIRLKLATGLETPVSRANVSLLKEQGWI